MTFSFTHNMITRLFLVGVTSMLVLLQQANATVHWSENYHYYEVNPKDIKTMRFAFNHATPIKRDGRSFHGHTKWHISWNYRYEKKSGYCRISQVNTKLKIDYTLPVLNKKAKRHADIRAVWETWYPKLLKHERTHKALSKKTADIIDKRIAKMTAPDCKTLGEMANKYGMQELDKLKKAHRHYDKRTQHGQTEGAKLGSYVP